MSVWRIDLVATQTKLPCSHGVLKNSDKELVQMEGNVVVEEMSPITEKTKTSILHKILTVIGAILCAIFGFMLACNITIIVKATLNPDTPPSVFGFTPMAVLSGSMSGDAPDHIEVGDLIFVGKTDIQELKIGDVIAFMPEKSVTTHRIVGIETDDDGKLLFTTKGDANNTQDANPVHEDDVIGIYLGRIPKLGDLALFMQTPLGIIIFVCTPMLLFMIYDIIRRKLYSIKERKQTEALQAEILRLSELNASEVNPEGTPAENIEGIAEEFEPLENPEDS